MMAPTTRIPFLGEQRISIPVVKILHRVSEEATLVACMHEMEHERLLVIQNTYLTSLNHLI